MGSMRLIGKTIFITGASRGIGKAIALRCAADGANVVIAAKTAQPHPKLPGTIYTAAEEVEKAGGKCLPCVVDIRFEDQVQRAVDEAVREFGGIDILVNNASALETGATESMSMKRYDLMNNINSRGTFLCSKLCLPHLKKAKNPHILNISPPLNMDPKWLKARLAYTIAKYGASMCVLGMAEEFRDDGIAVNSIWPRTVVYTAVAEVRAGEWLKAHSRSPDIMADAAFSIFTKDSRQYTGNITTDEDVLVADGVTDFSKYLYSPSAHLSLDTYIEGEDRRPVRELATALATINFLISPQLVQAVGAVFQFDFDYDGVYYLDLKTGCGSLSYGRYPGSVDLTMKVSVKDFSSIIHGGTSMDNALSDGKASVTGNPGMLTKLGNGLKAAVAQAKL